MKNHIIERNAATFSVYPQPHKIVMNQDHERYDFKFDTLLQTIVKQEILSRWIRFKYFILVLSNLDIIYIVGSNTNSYPKFYYIDSRYKRIFC